jgi:hypothetical protein
VPHLSHVEGQTLNVPHLSHIEGQTLNVPHLSHVEGQTLNSDGLTPDSDGIAAYGAPACTRARCA